MRLAPDDFLPLDDFPLAWRWRGDRSAMGDAERARIRPLRPERAREAWAEAVAFVGDPWLFRPSPARFPDIAEWNASGRSSEAGHAWLAEHVPGGDADPVLVAWEADRVVLTDRALFLRFWDDLCFPASDDVIAWPLSEAPAPWAVLWWHEEVLYVGRAVSDG